MDSETTIVAATGIESMDSLPAVCHQSLSATCVPSLAPSPMTVIRPPSAAGQCMSVIRPSLSDTISMVPGPYSMVGTCGPVAGRPFDAQSVQFNTTQLRNTSPSLPDLRFPGMQPHALQHWSQPVPQQMHSNPNSCMFTSKLPPTFVAPISSVPVSATIPGGASVPAQPLPAGIPYFVPSRHPSQFIAPTAPAAVYYRPQEGFCGDATNLSTPASQPPSQQ